MSILPETQLWPEKFLILTEKFFIRLKNVNSDPKVSFLTIKVD